MGIRGFPVGEGEYAGSWARYPLSLVSVDGADLYIKSLQNSEFAVC